MAEGKSGLSKQLDPSRIIPAGVAALILGLLIFLFLSMLFGIILMVVGLVVVVVGVVFMVVFPKE